MSTNAFKQTANFRQKDFQAYVFVPTTEKPKKKSKNKGGKSSEVPELR